MSVDGNPADVAVLGLPELRLLGSTEVDGELELTVETRAERDWCRECGVRAHAHDRRDVVVRDLGAFDRPARLRWRKRVWRCREPLCETATWTETIDAVAARQSMTQRARRNACQRVGRDGQAVAQVARDMGVGWHTIMRAVKDYGQPLVDDAARLEDVTALGVDETAWLTATRWRHTQFISGLVDTATSAATGCGR